MLFLHGILCSALMATLVIENIWEDSCYYVLLNFYFCQNISLSVLGELCGECSVSWHIIQVCAHLEKSWCLDLIIL